MATANGSRYFDNTQSHVSQILFDGYDDSVLFGGITTNAMRIAPETDHLNASDVTPVRIYLKRTYNNNNKKKNTK